jgi:hypothetical protein
MSGVEKIDRFLRAQLAAEGGAASRAAEPGVRPFVTISRQAGAGGLPLAEVMLDVFTQQSDARVFGGWQVYDRHLCEIVASDPTFAGSLDSLLESHHKPKPGDFLHQIFGPTTHQTMLMDRVFLVVHTLAAMGKAIIVGRGGSEVTKAMAQGISLRLVAAEKSRVARIMEMLDLSEPDARAVVRKRDTDRARLMKDHFGVDIADPAGYDMTWNTDSSSFVEIADSVAVLVRSRVPRD